MKKKMISAIEWLFGLVGVMMILVETYAVLARNVLLVSTPWVDELLKLLFVWSMIPMLGARVREVMGGRRRRSASRISALGAWMEGRRLHPVAFLCGACAMAAVAMFCSAYTIGTTVTYDGEVVAAVSSLSAAEDARSNLEKATARTLGETYTIDDSMIQYSSSLLKRQDVVDEAELEEDLSQEIGLVTSAYCLYVDGERIGATTYEGALEELLQQLKAASTNEGSSSGSSPLS